MKNEQRQKILYGAGAMGKQAFEFYTKDDPNAVYCFADTFKYGTEYMGKPVISIKELAAIKDNYDIVICVWDLFDLMLDFDDEKIYNFEVWKDDMLDSFVHDKWIVESGCKKRKVDETKKNQMKILYGAGRMGGDMYRFFGDDAVFAFADWIKAGTTYLGKAVLHPSELVELQNDYEIIISMFENAQQAADYLISTGVKLFTIVEFDDVRLWDRKYYDAVFNDTTYDSRVLEIIKDLDFIENPDFVSKYNDKHIKQSRMRMPALVSSEKKDENIMKRYIQENLMYGKFDEMAKYACRNLEFYEAPAIIHGYPAFNTYPMQLDWHNLIWPGELNNNLCHEVSRDCLVFTVGPFFHYAESFYSEEKVAKIKLKQGRNLTAFPMHSTATVKYLYDEKEFVKKVVHEARQFDSLTVSVHHICHNDNVVHMFRAEGAKIVSPGFFLDPSFIRRLKTIMMMSDAIVTNRIGSHVGHAISLRKPVKLLPQDVMFRSLYFKESTVRANMLNLDAPVNKVLMIDEYRVTQDMLDVYEPIIGFGHIKSKEEMAAIFDLSKRLMQNCGYKKSKLIDSIRQEYRSLQQSQTKEEKLQFRLMREALPKNYDEYLKGLGV